MPDRTEDLFDGLDGPRPLPRELRQRLEAELLGAAALPLGDALDARLRDALTDPVGQLLVDVDRPRPLPAALRDRLEASLAPRRRRPVPPFAVGAAAAVVAILAVALIVISPGGGRGNNPSATSAKLPSTATAPGAPGAVAGGSTLGGAAGAGTAGSVRVPGPSTPANKGFTTGDAASGTGGGTAMVPAASPGLSSVAPSAGPVRGGSTVTLHGSGLATAVAVSFGSRPAASFQVVSDSTITAVTPAVGAPATVDVTVALRSGARYDIAAAYTFVAPPRVDAVSPGSGSFQGGTWVTVTGAALRRTPQVRFGDTAASRVQVVSDGKLRALSPRHLPGPVDIVVTTPGGTSATGQGDRFTYLP